MLTSIYRGFSCQAQVRCQAQLLAQDSWCCHEPCRSRKISLWLVLYIFSRTTPDKNSLCSLTVVVTTSTSVRPRPSLATPPTVKKPVLLLPGELVCSAVPRRPRNKCDLVRSFVLFDGLKMLFCYETYVLRRLRITFHTSLAN